MSGIIFDTEQLSNKKDELSETLKQWSDKPYSAHFLEKLKRYWVKALNKPNYNILSKNENGKYEIDTTRTLEVEEMFDKLNMERNFELMIRATIDTGQGVVFTYPTSSGVRRFKASQNLVRLVEDETGELLLLEVMDNIQSGTYVATVMTTIERKGKVFRLMYSLVDKAGLKIKDQKKAWEEFKDNFGYTPTDQDNISQLEAQVLNNIR